MCALFGFCIIASGDARVPIPPLIPPRNVEGGKTVVSFSTFDGEGRDEVLPVA